MKVYLIVVKARKLGHNKNVTFVVAAKTEIDSIIKCKQQLSESEPYKDDKCVKFEFEASFICNSYDIVEPKIITIVWN